MDIEALQRAVASTGRILLDSMVFIYLLDGDPVYADLAAAVLALVEAGTVTAVTSTLTLTEVLTAPARAGDEEALLDYELYLTHFPNLQLHPLDQHVARQAARVRGATGLRTPDAVQIGTALVATASGIVTNDRAWQGKTGDLTLLLLDDYLS